MVTIPVRGRILVHARGFGFIEIEGGEPTPAAFVTPPELNPFLAGDVVTATLVPAGDGRFNATGLALVERARAELFGTLTFHAKRPFVKTDRQVANTDWPVEGGVEGLREGDAVVGRLAGAKVGPLRSVAGDLGLARILVRHGVRDSFTPAQLADAAARAKEGFDASGRRDLRSLTTVTIDAASTKDIDDALSVIPPGDDGALRVLVSIADVDAVVPVGSPLDEEARLRATSVYLAGHVVPMLPNVLCDDAVSLIEGHDRPAVTVELRIDDEGVVTSVDIYKSLMRSHGRLTYDAVDEYFEAGRPGDLPAAVLPTLRWLRTAAARLSTIRATRGGVELMREEAYVTLDAVTNAPTGLEVRIDTEAHRLVERLMVAANEAVAAWLVDRGLPGVFRVHEEPDAERVALLAAFAHNLGFEAGFGRRLSPRGLSAFEAQFRRSPAAPALRTALATILPPARYTAEAGVHFGLAAPLYLHFTSPIRRYSDLAVHRVVKRFLEGDRDFEGTSFGELAEHLQRASLAAAKAERDRLRTLAARLFRGRIGETMAGHVVGIKPFGLVIQLDGQGVGGTVATEALEGGPFRLDAIGQALVGTARSYQIGEPMTVTVVGANEDLGRIELAPVQRAAT